MPLTHAIGGDQHLAGCCTSGKVRGTVAGARGSCRQVCIAMFRCQAQVSSAKGRASERLVMRRAMAEEDSRDGAPGAVAEAAGTAGAALYEPGAFQQSGLEVLF